MTKLYEEVNPTQYVERGIMNVDDAAVRDNINTLLTGSLMSCTLTSYIALEKVRKVLSYFHINIPAVPFMEGDRGVQVFDVHQFGNLTGMRNDGEVVTKVSQPYSIYFEYQQNEKGMFDVFCEIVTQDELEDLLDDAEEDINDDGAEDDREDRLNESSESVSLAGSETGTKRIAGAPESDMCDSAKMAAMKILKELIQYDLSGKKTIHPGTASADSLIKGPYVRDPNKKPEDYIRTLPHTTSSAGNDPFKGVTPRTPGTPAPALKSGEMSIHDDNLSKPYNPSPTRFSSIKEPEPMTSAGGYQEKIQETSHESVNHVRRLAMKNKRNDR